MLPITIIKTIQKASSKHCDLFTTILTNRFIEENLIPNNVGIKTCPLNSISSTIKELVSIIPEELFQADLFSLSMKRDPITQKTSLFPVFIPENILEAMKAQNIIHAFKLNIINEKDDFTFNGTRQAVEHTKTKLPHNTFAGSYLEITLKNGNVNVWTMTPEESIQAAQIWNDKIFDHTNTIHNMPEFYLWIMFLRAIKTMTAMISFNENNPFSLLLSNIHSLYTHYFDEYNYKKEDRFALSVQNNSRFLCDQPSELEIALKTLPEIKINPVVKLKHYKKNENTLEKINENNDKKGIIVHFGIGGW